METLGRLRHPKRVILDSQETKTYLFYKAHVKFCLYLSVLFWDVTIECSQGNRIIWSKQTILQASSPVRIPTCRDGSLSYLAVVEAITIFARLWKEGKPPPTALPWLSPVLCILLDLPHPSNNPQTLRIMWTKRSALWQALQLRLSRVWMAGSPSLPSEHASFALPSPLFPTGLSLRRVAFQWQVRFKRCDNWRFSSFRSCLCSDCNFIACQRSPREHQKVYYLPFILKVVKLQ